MIKLLWLLNIQIYSLLKPKAKKRGGHWGGQIILQINTIENQTIEYFKITPMEM